MTRRSSAAAGSAPSGGVTLVMLWHRGEASSARLGSGMLVTGSASSGGWWRRRSVSRTGGSAELRWRAVRAGAASETQGRLGRHVDPRAAAYKGAQGQHALARTPRTHGGGGDGAPAVSDTDTGRRPKSGPGWAPAGQNESATKRRSGSRGGPRWAGETAARGRGEEFKGRQRTSISGLRLLVWASSGESQGGFNRLRRVGSAR